MENNSAHAKHEEFEEKVKEANTVRKIVFITLSSIILIFAIAIVSVYFYISSALKPVDVNNTEEVELEIPLGSSSSDIATILEDNNIIKNAKIFKYYTKFKNVSSFQAGEYVLSPSMTIDEVIEQLQTGILMNDPLFRVTIPEGKNIEQMATIFAKKLDFSEEAFIDTVSDKSFIEEMKKEFPELITDEVDQEDLYMALEGYLFAGTYDVFDEKMSAKELITNMIERTNEMIQENSEAIEDSKFTVHEILTLASVIERESKFPEDRPKVAQVYINRLNEDMKLQSDITSFYDLKNLEHKAVVTYDDIEIETPYNTYVIDGLPVGPIASPSTEAIEGVLHPEGKEFTQLYYFSRPNGETFYSDTLDQHNEIISKYRQEWYDLENEKAENKDEKDE